MDLSHIRFQGKPAAIKRSRHPPRTLRRTIDISPADRQPDVISELAAVVLREAGLDPAAYRSRPLQRRLAACVRALKTDSESAAIGRVRNDPVMRSRALGALLIGVSSFFRDPEVFLTIRATIVPALRERERSGPVRVLSVGCSSGAELYSIAMLLAEAGLLDQAHLVGIDCREEAVDSARAGIFPGNALNDLDAEIQSRFFERTPDGWSVVSSLRQAILWQLADATRRLPEGPWDLVLCRNLIMYLRNGTSEHLLRQIAARLRPGGFLVLGRAERSPAFLQLAPVGRSVYRSHVI